MDVAAARYQQPRVRAQSYLDRENGTPAAAADESGPECEPLTSTPSELENGALTSKTADSLPRRKFQRTGANPDNSSNDVFRKPSVPASAARRTADRRPSDSARRRSTNLREGIRVPSGPREFPGSPGKRFGNMGSDAPSTTDNAPSRAFLPTPVSFPSPTRRTNPSSDVKTGSPTAPAGRPNGDFDFIPPVNFDDFQSRLANFDGSSSLLSEFPAVGGGRVLPHDKSGDMAARTAGFADARAATGRLEEQSERAVPDVGRSASYKQTYGTGVAPRVPTGQGNVKDAAAPPQPAVSLRTRRQSTVPQNSSTIGQTPPGQPLPGQPLHGQPLPGPGQLLPSGSTSSARPRKSVGPGLFSSVIERKPVPQQAGPPVPPESSKPTMTRSSSLSKARRSVVQPSASAGAELPRVSTLTATTQSRQAKVRSVVPVVRDVDASKSPGKSTTLRVTTPTASSGSKRQSVASGRMSGLGARTISPTDARRLKRMSTVNAPPMPTHTHTHTPRRPHTPQDDDPIMPARLPDLPRFAEPAPTLSFIPRKASASHSLTPTSARASPETKATLAKPAETSSLSHKSSFQSLTANPNNSTSRLPQLKSRNVHSSSAQYGEDSEVIPPVPAIPKNYESPKEWDASSYFRDSRKSSTTTFGDNAGIESSNALAPPVEPAPRSSFDAPTTETPRKATHRRNKTIGSPTTGTTTSTRSKPQAEQTGRRNNTLQPLRLPPLNLLPLSSPSVRANTSHHPPAAESEDHDPYSLSSQTPEPKRVPKTPSTPMTASKATFFRRQEKEKEAAQKQLRSASSQYALREMMGYDESVTRFFDDSDPEPVTTGIPIQSSKQSQARSAITPFASGSLPKHSSEFVRLRGRPSGEYKTDGQPFSLATFGSLRQKTEKPQGQKGMIGGGDGGPAWTGYEESNKPQSSTRQLNSGTGTSYKTANETPGSGDSPITDSAPPPPLDVKKESGGLRRKLSLGWRRTSSKGASQPDNKNTSSPQETPAEKSKPTIRTIPKPGAMPPPKLPASATWSGELPSLPSSTRPSLDFVRKKSNAGVVTNSGSNSEQEAQPPAPPPKTRALHSEQPQAVSNRASSWGNFSFGNRSVAARVNANGASKPKPAAPATTISAIIKDKDDYAADEEMRRLSQKRRDVDQAARETELLKKRAVARSPASPEQVLHDRNCSLNIFERGEIMDFEKEGVYFTGTKDARKIIGSVSSLTGDKEKSGNHGYDDERGDYNIVFGDHLSYRYEVIDVLGKGSFGQVVRCVDHKEGGIVAVKIIRNKKRFHQQALVEVGILGRLRDWDPDESYATLSITSSFYFRSHLCIVTPCLSINLYEFIRAHNFQGFSLPLIRRFSKQMVACLVLLQQKHIIHCDLKPENILLCEARKADVRVIDFGSSCREEEKVYTYIQSRFYRSPEVILGSSYGLGIDMWSFGCILAELWTGYPIFPGENEQEQLACIMEIFGPPDRHLVEKCTRKKLFFDSVGKPRVTVSSKGRRRRPSSKTLQQALKSDDEAFLDFIARCLRWDPDRRLKPNDAMNHPFITNMPLNQRPGIPDEARRAARIRSAANTASTSNSTSTANASIPSPVKRAANAGNAFAQQQVQQASTRSTPQTSIRSVPAQASPAKTTLPAGVSRRQPSSSINDPNTPTSSSIAAGAGVKRGNNGTVLGSQHQNSSASGLPTMLAPSANSAVRQVQAGQTQSLAAMAARESMRDLNAKDGGSGGAQSGLGAARWRG